MQNSDYFFTIQSAQKLCEFPTTKETKIAMQAMCSDIATYMAAVTQCAGKQMMPEDLMKTIEKMGIPGMKEKALEICKYITANPLAETENQ